MKRFLFLSAIFIPLIVVGLLTFIMLPAIPASSASTTLPKTVFPTVITTPTYTIQPSYTVNPTYTFNPTNTVVPTFTTIPTLTIQPSYTINPSYTIQPTLTSVIPTLTTLPTLTITTLPTTTTVSTLTTVLPPRTLPTIPGNIAPTLIATPSKTASPTSNTNEDSPVVTIAPSGLNIPEEPEPEYTIVPSDVTLVGTNTKLPQDTGTIASIAEGAKFAITDLTTSTGRISPGETVKVTATVENVGNQAGSCKILLIVNGQVETSRTVRALAAGSRDLVQFEFTEDTPATYKIQVGEEVASLVVAKGLNFTKIIIFVVGAIVALLIIGGLVRWATKRE
jgi:hypothetical protein